MGTCAKALSQQEATSSSQFISSLCFRLSLSKMQFADLSRTAIAACTDCWSEMVQHACAGHDAGIETRSSSYATAKCSRSQEILQGRSERQQDDARILPGQSLLPFYFSPRFSSQNSDQNPASQLGHILPSTSSASNAVTAIPRKRTFVEELVDDEQAKAYTKRKFQSEVMVRGMSGRGRSKKGGRAKGRGGKGRA